MIKDVNVTIDLQKVIGKAGLGYPLIVFYCGNCKSKVR